MRLRILMIVRKYRGKIREQDHTRVMSRVRIRIIIKP